MGRTTITAQETARTSISALTFSDIGADGVQYLNTGEEILLFMRDAALTSTITVKTNNTVDGVDLPDVDVAMAAGDTTPYFKTFGKVTKGTYNQDGGYVQIDSDDSDDMVAVIRPVA